MAGLVVGNDFLPGRFIFGQQFGTYIYNPAGGRTDAFQRYYPEFVIKQRIAQVLVLSPMVMLLIFWIFVLEHFSKFRLFCLIFGINRPPFAFTNTYSLNHLGKCVIPDLVDHL